MAITNKDRVTRGLDLLRDGLKPFVERELKSKYGDRWPSELRAALSGRNVGSADDPLQDPQILLFVTDKLWGAVFGNILSRGDRTLALELTDVRNKWAHGDTFSSDDVDRALDSVERLLTSVSAPQADEVRKLKLELRRTVYDEQVRGAQRKAGGTLIDSTAAANLSAWRDNKKGK